MNKKMNAKEMFERLGLYLDETPPFKDWIIYETKAGILGRSVTFDLTYKGVITNEIIHIELYKAITQQMKELGWI